MNSLDRVVWNRLMALLACALLLLCCSPQIARDRDEEDPEEKVDFNKELEQTSRLNVMQKGFGRESQKGLNVHAIATVDEKVATTVWFPKLCDH